MEQEGRGCREYSSTERVKTMELTGDRAETNTLAGEEWPGASQVSERRKEEVLHSLDPWNGLSQRLLGMPPVVS